MTSIQVAAHGGSPFWIKNSLTSFTKYILLAIAVIVIGGCAPKGPVAVTPIANSLSHQEFLRLEEQYSRASPSPQSQPQALVDPCLTVLNLVIKEMIVDSKLKQTYFNLELTGAKEDIKPKDIGFELALITAVFFDDTDRVWRWNSLNNSHYILAPSKYSHLVSSGTNKIRLEIPYELLLKKRSGKKPKLIRYVIAHEGTAQIVVGQNPIQVHYQGRGEVIVNWISGKGMSKLSTARFRE